MGKLDRILSVLVIVVAGAIGGLVVAIVSGGGV